MQIYKIEFEKKASKFIEKQDKEQRIRLMKAIYKLPSGSDIKKIHGHNSLYRLRVGNYRIVYSCDDIIKVVTIENIDNRGDVYKGL